MINKLLFSYIMKLNKKKFGSVGDNSVIPLSMKNIQNPSNIFIGKYVKFGSDMVIYATINSKVIIKDGSIFAPRCKIFTSNHNYDSFDLQSIPYDHINLVEDVVIGEGCWIGDSVIILPGVTIGKGAIVGSGCVVSKDVPNYAVVVGNPMRIVKYRDSSTFDKLLLEEKFNINKNNNKKKFVRRLGKNSD
ncbi:acyltransferase [Trichococcus flocculiformis]|uniref:acyltransferase n=1 Tax=Trichococcus flocculiformis TaxID=82803 RepID=UPI002AAA8A26|nr:acyltransferase [Trichococcus flocculiformis]